MGLTLERQEGHYGWRRCSADLFDAWETTPRVKDLITGHDELREPRRSSTRMIVYLNPKDLPLLRAGRRLMEHVRTEFVRTGRGASGVPADGAD